MNTSKNEILRALLSSDGVVGSKERWWTGNKAFDFLGKGEEYQENNIEEVEEASKNICDRVERLLEELISPTQYESPALTDIEAVQRALDFILSLALDEQNFCEFGSDALSCFYDVSTTSPEPLRKFALLRTEITAQYWLKRNPALLKENDDGESDLDGDVVVDWIMGLYSLERVGIGHDAKEEVRTAASKMTVEDFFNLDPSCFRIRSLPVDGPPMSHSEYTTVLSSTFYAVKTGISVHVDLSTALKLLPTFRPYKKFSYLKQSDDEFSDYSDQITMIFNVVHVLSSYGELRLSPELLPLEFNYLSNPLHLDRAIEFKDVHLIGEICHCLRVFGTLDSSMSRGLQFLRESQNLDGSWPARDNELPYFRYHAAMCAVSALNPQRFRGFGPCDPELADDLLRLRYATKKGYHAGAPAAVPSVGTDSLCPNVIPKSHGMNSLAMETILDPIGNQCDVSEAPNGGQKLVSNRGGQGIFNPKAAESVLYAPYCPDNILNPISDLLPLRDYYDAKADSVRIEIEMMPQIYGMNRLKTLLEEKAYLYFSGDEQKRRRGRGRGKSEKYRSSDNKQLNKKRKHHRKSDDDDWRP